MELPQNKIKEIIEKIRDKSNRASVFFSLIRKVLKVSKDESGESKDHTKCWLPCDKT